LQAMSVQSRCRDVACYVSGLLKSHLYDGENEKNKTSDAGIFASSVLAPKSVTVTPPVTLVQSEAML
jgi:hypothetical protein